MIEIFYNQYTNIQPEINLNIDTHLNNLFTDFNFTLSSLNIIFLTDDELLKINKSYLNHDYYTDIITFNLSEEGSKEINGELYISIDTVKDNAPNFAKSFQEELHRVMIHGCLHLVGFKDESDEQEQEMRVKENQYLEKMFHVKHLSK